MLQEFLTWWAQQLLSLLPGRLTGRAARRDGVRLTLDDALARVSAVVVRRGRARPALSVPLNPPGLAELLAATGPRPYVTELALPPGRVLEQAVSLPLAAEQDPARVLRYEMDRLTPFAADDLFWSWRLQSRDRARGVLSLLLSLTPRAPLLPVLEALAMAGLQPLALRSGSTVIGLQRQAGQAWTRRVRWGLAGLCAVLAVAAVVVPFVRQSRQSRGIERAIAGLRPAVEQAEALRRRAAAAAAGVDVLAAQRAESGSALEMLAALTAALPDDTVLTDLAYRARTATVSGQSAAAVRLIPLLTADPALRGTAFTAPVTRNETTRSQGFTLRTELAP